jgi:hypothetical protein
LQRRALGVLAESGPNGATVEGLVAAGFKIPTIRRLVRHGFAVVTRQRMKAGGEAVQSVRVNITDAGRAALSKAADKSTGGTTGR